MTENPSYPKIITRPSLETTDIIIGKLQGHVKYTSDWAPVEEGRGVSVRTWTLEGDTIDSPLVDGADIIIEAGGYTSIQLVNSANVVVDALETDTFFSVVLDAEGQIYVNGPDRSNQQLIYTKGMIIALIATDPSRFTEFEQPAFHNDMFTTVPENSNVFQNRDMTEYLKIVRTLRQAFTVTS